jgi:hypothetical protein
MAKSDAPGRRIGCGLGPRCVDTDVLRPANSDLVASSDQVNSCSDLECETYQEGGTCRRF